MATIDLTRLRIFTDIEAERQCQDKRWGVQHKRRPEVWLAVLVEGHGRVSTEVLNILFSIYPHPSYFDLRARLVQLVAVAVAWLECIDHMDNTVKGA